MLRINQYLKSVEASKNKDQVIYSPQYFIPDLNDWTLVKESILSKNLEINEIVIANNSNSKRESKKDQKDVKNVPDYILGNVSELVDLEGKTFGGSYLDSKADILNMTFKDEKIPNDNVGFRCFYKWVKIGYD